MRNLTLLTDLYQLTMMNAYLETGKHETMANFDIFFREKEHLEYAVCAGLEQAVEYIAPDELVEITPTSLRLRKKILSHLLRKRSERASEEEEA